METPIGMMNQGFAEWDACRSSMLADILNPERKAAIRRQRRNSPETQSALRLAVAGAMCQRFLVEEQ